MSSSSVYRLNEAERMLTMRKYQGMLIAAMIVVLGAAMTVESGVLQLSRCV